MERKELIPEWKNARAGDHLCLLYRTEEEREEAVLDYLHEGLERDERVIFVGGEEVAASLREALARTDVDANSLIAGGQLSFLDAREIYLPDGCFHPGDALRFWSAEMARAVEAGWKAIRIAGDASWALEEPPGSEQLARYESEVNRLHLPLDCILLCTYDLRAFSPETLLDVLRTHPKVAVGTELFDNIYYLPPGEFLGNMTAQSILGYHLAHLKDRKLALQQIQSAREYAEAIVDTVREPLLVLDAGLRVITANRSFYRTFRVTPEETEGRLVYELGDRRWDIQELRRLLEEVVPLNTSFEGYEVVHDFEHIGRRTMLLNARRIYREGNRTEMILLAIEDITERKRAEERMQKLHRMFLSLGADFLANMETVITNCRDIMEGDMAAYARLVQGRLFVLTTAPGEEGLILLEEASRFLGWPLLSGEREGPLAVTVTPASVDPPRGDPLAECHGYLSFLGYPVSLHGRTVGVLSVYYREDHRHMSQENQEILAIMARTLAIEEERLAREEGLKDFIDIASHELRHPTALLKGYALSLKERWESLGEQEAQEVLSAIDHGADRLTSLADNLLDFSRIERGNFQPDSREVELLTPLKDAVQSVGRQQGQITLVTRGRVGACRADSKLLRRLMVILLENALKFSAPGSPVEVEVKEVEGAYQVSVLDRGPGIPEDEKSRIFDRFYQVDEARFHSKPGVGLGLYIAREIVERLRGRIWHEHREGGGSVFGFTIPKHT